VPGARSGPAGIVTDIIIMHAATSTIMQSIVWCALMYAAWSFDGFWHIGMMLKSDFSAAGDV
jgi:hypothetical protein